MSPWWPVVTIVQSDVTIVVPLQLSTGRLHDYHFYYCTTSVYSIWGTENCDCIVDDISNLFIVCYLSFISTISLTPILKFTSLLPGPVSWEVESYYQLVSRQNLTYCNQPIPKTCRPNLLMQYYQNLFYTRGHYYLDHLCLPSATLAPGVCLPVLHLIYPIYLLIMVKFQLMPNILRQQHNYSSISCLHGTNCNIIYERVPKANVDVFRNLKRR